jgi:5-methylcytosine-specific restriction endonuclease McrA
MITVASFDAKDIFPYVKSPKLSTNAKGRHFIKDKDKIYYTYEGNKINVGSKKLILFKRNPICICCGIEGTIINLCKYKNDDALFFELFAKREFDGVFVKMTIDHVIPLSLGGLDIIENMQTMCYYCNNARGNRVLTQEVISSIREHMPFFNTLKAPSVKARIANIMKKMCPDYQQLHDLPMIPGT